MKSQIKFGKNIRNARKSLNLTQSEVAEKAGVNSNYYARIERGEVNPSMDMLEAILKVLKLKSSDVLPF